MTPWPYPRWIAHRGAGRLAPENTLAAFRLGAEHGFRMFECDAKLSADGVPFLLHDATLERTTNGVGTGGDQPWDQLARLDAGSWHSRQYAGEPLPTLENVARFCIANGCFLNTSAPNRCRRRSRRSRSCRAACWSTRSATAGGTPRSVCSARPWSATTPCGTRPPWRRCRGQGCAA
jgi:glycerophosphoryl diester phosphodiesterase